MADCISTRIGGVIDNNEGTDGFAAMEYGAQASDNFIARLFQCSVAFSAAARGCGEIANFDNAGGRAPKTQKAPWVTGGLVKR